MTDNEIIKALECCSSHDWQCDENCPFFGFCSKYLMSSESLNILKRQKAEIELLSGRIDTINDTNKILIDSQEIYWKNRVKEFAERLKEKNDNPGKAMFDVYEYYGETIDSLVKEMTEEKE